MNDDLIRRADVLALAKDVTLDGGAKHRCIDATMIHELPSAEREYAVDEWCHDCKEYDTEKHCCPRFNRVIRTTLNERRGKWIERDEDCTWECSACGELWTLIEGTPKQNGMNFCPNCGAKMEGEE